MNTLPNSETPRTDAATCDSRNGIRSSEGTVVLASFARQLEKELNEAKQLHVEDMRLCGKHGCLSYKELEQLLVEKNITANTFMAQVKKLQANETQLTSRIEASERANSEMGDALKHALDCYSLNESFPVTTTNPINGQISAKTYNVYRQLVLYSTSGQSYIPREVGEKMYEALGFAKVAFNKADISLPFTEHKMDDALQLAQKHGLGKKT